MSPRRFTAILSLCVSVAAAFGGCTSVETTPSTTSTSSGGGSSGGGSSSASSSSSTGTTTTSLCVPGASESCYDGPAGTADVGLCKSGTRICAADGASWGACTGEVLPSAAACDLVDHDCDGTPDHAPSCCLDGIQDGDETDVDCGGTSCPPCSKACSCIMDADCAGGAVCLDHCICAPASCADGKKDGSESDVDCGKACLGCATGRACGDDGDCASHHCIAGVCQ